MSAFFILKIICGILSGLGCCFISTTYLCYESGRSFPFEQVVGLVISSFLTACTYFIYDTEGKTELNPDDTFLCKIQGFAMVWFENTQLLFAVLIGFCVYISVAYFEDGIDIEIPTWGRRLKYLSVAYLSPLIVCIGLWFLDVYGISGEWCWIDTNERSTLKNVISGILFWGMWVLILTTFFFHWAAYKVLLKEVKTEDERDLIKKYMWKLSIFSIIQVICILPGTINKFLQVQFSLEVAVFQYAHLIFQMLQGFFFAIAHGYNRQVRETIRKAFTEKFRGIFLEKRKTLNLETQEDQEGNKLDSSMKSGEDQR